MSEAQTFFVTVVAILTTIGLVIKGCMILGTKVIRPIGQIWDGLFGDDGDEKNGIPPRLGVLARVTALEQSHASLHLKVDTAVAELSPNHGQSTYDRVKSISSVFEGQGQQEAA